MAIEWENIPITLRCTCREKIDPTYSPQNFWKLDPKSAGTNTLRKTTESTSKYVPLIVNALRGRELTRAELADALGIRSDFVDGMLGGLSHNVLVYEVEGEGRKRFGLLESA